MHLRKLMAARSFRYFAATFTDACVFSHFICNVHPPPA
jgi:hypothetical protein